MPTRGPRFSAPDPTLGYVHGNPIWGGYGSNMGKTAGTATAPAGIATGGTANGSWHPTVKYMLLLVVVELIAFGWLIKLAG